ncbi:MAG: hypothetical protein K2P26_11480 [Oscillospiraceae bacterium]|nr:hypothetical protein [Oscillospiraceae bacterium]
MMKKIIITMCALAVVAMIPPSIAVIRFLRCGGFGGAYGWFLENIDRINEWELIQIYWLMIIAVLLLLILVVLIAIFSMLNTKMNKSNKQG